MIECERLQRIMHPKLRMYDFVHRTHATRAKPSNDSIHTYTIYVAGRTIDNSLF